MSQTAIAERSDTPGAALESVVIEGDLSELTPEDRVSYYRSVCESLGLNPLTKPFEYLILNDRLTLYARRDATDQLRASRGISVEITHREFLREAGLYVVTARAVAKDGRTDESVGAVNVKGLYGETLANALMKAETKAKRRVTLSVSGLGWLDETEIVSVAEAQRVTLDRATGEVIDRPPPEPRPGIATANGRVNWSAFWGEAKRLGFDQKAVHALAGTASLIHLDQGAIEDLLNLMRDRAELAAASALPPEAE